MSDKKKKIEKYLEADQIGRTESGPPSLDSAVKVQLEKEPPEKETEIAESASGKAPEPVPGDATPDSSEKALTEARQEAREFQDKYLRLYAEFDNYKKRTARESADFRKYANESLIKEMLTVVDNLERAVESFNAHPETDSALVQGVQLTLKEIFAVLERNNVTPIDAVGKPFDPRYHLAFQQEEADEYPENTIVRVYQKGYLLYDRLLRPSMVVVSKKKKKPGADQNSE